MLYLQKFPETRQCYKYPNHAVMRIYVQINIIEFVIHYALLFVNHEIRFETTMQQNYLSVNRQHCEFNPFHANVPFPYPHFPVFISIPLVFSGFLSFSGGIKMEH